MNLQEWTILRGREDAVFLQDVLQRVTVGMTTYHDADYLRTVLVQQQQDIINLTASIEDALVFDYGVSFEEEANDEQGTCEGLSIRTQPAG